MLKIELGKPEPGFIDDIGGYHHEAEGWDPEGNWCGECTAVSCQFCKVWQDRQDTKIINYTYK